MIKRGLKIILVVFFSIIFIAIIGVLFVKFDTPVAAEFTDKYLRPILGTNFVVEMEKVFYNTSDKITQLTYRNNGQGFQFLNNGDTTNIYGGDLNLSTIPSLFSTPQKDEGVWKNYQLNIFPGKEVMAYSYVRPDPARPYANVFLVQLDMSKLKIGSVAGTKEPAGAVGMPGPGKIPTEIIQSGNLIAAFDGGFQYKDGAYGMIVGNTTYLPLKNDLATLVGYTSGKISILKYEGVIPSGQYDFVRQNCPMLVENGQIATYNDVNRQLWGRTPTTSIYTWRSGLGITANGNLVFAVGNNLIPDTLAQALKMAGAVNAMQLDINPYWVRFNIFNSKGDGTYYTTPLAKGIYDGSKQYLNGYQKDFFYVYKI